MEPLEPSEIRGPLSFSLLFASAQDLLGAVDALLAVYPGSGNRPLVVLQ